MKRVRYINKSDSETIMANKLYGVIGETDYCYIIKNEIGDDFYYSKSLFEVVEEPKAERLTGRALSSDGSIATLKKVGIMLCSIECSKNTASCTNCPIQEAFDKLAKFEDAEELKTEEAHTCGECSHFSKVKEYCYNLKIAAKHTQMWCNKFTTQPVQASEDSTEGDNPVPVKQIIITFGEGEELHVKMAHVYPRDVLFVGELLRTKALKAMQEAEANK